MLAFSIFVAYKWNDYGVFLEITIEVRPDLDDAFIKKVGSSMKATDITRDARAMFNWAVEEIAAGRVILSAKEDGGELHRLVTPTLSKISKE